MLDVFQEGEYTFVSADIVTLLVGCVISFIVAFLAVKFFIEILQKFGFKFFGFYRIILGSIILILLLIHK